MPAANLYRCTVTARDARRIARRFMNYQDMILRFAAHPDLDIFTNNQAACYRRSGAPWLSIPQLGGDQVRNGCVPPVPSK
jgi:hypothetical protein